MCIYLTHDYYKRRENHYIISRVIHWIFSVGRAQMVRFALKSRNVKRIIDSECVWVEGIDLLLLLSFIYTGYLLFSCTCRMCLYRMYVYILIYFYCVFSILAIMSYNFSSYDGGYSAGMQQSRSFSNFQEGVVMNGVDTAAFEMLKQGGWTGSERATLQQIKHSNDQRLNPAWGPNPFHGPQDSTVEALSAMSAIVQNRQNRGK